MFNIEVARIFHKVLEYVVGINVAFKAMDLEVSITGILMAIKLITSLNFEY